MIPRWLEAHLTDLGRWNADGVGRAIRSRVCRCGAHTLRALDDDMCGLPVTVDPGPLDPVGEMQALISGRATYRLLHTNSRWEIDRRTQFDIAAQPAGAVDVLAAHQCGQIISADGPPINNPRPLIKARSDASCPPY